MHNSLRTLDKRKQDGGFTLIELLIVVLIIGILAAVVVVAVGNQQSTAQEKACAADASAMAAALDRLKLDNGDAVVAGTVAVKAGWNAFTAANLAALTGPNGKTFVPDYLKSIPASYDDAAQDGSFAASDGANNYGAACTQGAGNYIGVPK